MNELNKKIQKYNLVVPYLNMQKMLFNLEKEERKILECGQTKDDIAKMQKNANIQSEKEPKNFFSWIESIINRNRNY